MKQMEGETNKPPRRKKLLDRVQVQSDRIDLRLADDTHGADSTRD
jgi:hypothetical protein